MIDVKILKKVKGTGTTSGVTAGINTVGNTYRGGAVKEAAHAARADVADIAVNAETAALANEANHAATAYDLDENSPVNDKFISKTQDDTASGKITFSAGAEFGSFAEGVSGAVVDTKGNAEVEKLKARKRVDVGEYGAEAGASMFEDETGATHVVADVIHARRKFSAEEIEIKKMSHVGGTFMSSPAAAVISRVSELADNTGATFWRCYFMAADAEGRTVTNDFRSGDLVICKTYNLATEGDGTSGNRYYWRRVVGQPGTTSGAPSEHYIDLSDRQGYRDPSGTSVPAVGDDIVTVGNVEDAARQNVILLSSYDGGAGVAPCLLLYKGINTFELPDNKLTAKLSPSGNVINGVFKVLVNGEYKDVKDYADAAAQTYFDVNITGISTRVTNAEGDITALQQTAEGISLRVSDLVSAHPNLCKPFGDIAVSSDGSAAGYFGAVKPSGVDINALALTRAIPGCRTVTIRLRGRFGTSSTAINVFLGGWTMGVAIPRTAYTGGTEDEVITYTTKTPAAGTPGTSLWVQMVYPDADSDGASDMPTADRACHIASLIIVEGSVIPAELLADDSVTDKLSDTGIDIRKGQVQVTADNFVVVNNSGRQTAMVTADGKLSAHLIDANDITARHVLVGDEQGERVEINPAERAIEIYDNTGKLCTTLDGKKYADGPGDVYSDAASGTVSLAAGSRAASQGTQLQTYTSAEFTVASPCVLQFTAGGITVHVKSDGYTKQPSESPQGRSVGARVAFEVIDSQGTTVRTLWQTYASADAGDWNKEYELFDEIPDKEDTAAFDAATASCAMSPGTYRLRLSVTFEIEDTTKSSGSVMWSAFAAGWSTEGYISRYFANGFILGSASNRYVAAWHDISTGTMCCEVQNADCALRTDGSGPLQVRHSGSSVWMALPLPIMYGRISCTSSAASMDAASTKTYDGSAVTAFTVRREGTGKYHVSYPSSWQSQNFIAGRAVIRLTPVDGSLAVTAVLSAQTALGFSVALYRGSSAVDGSVAFEIHKIA